MVRRPAGGLGIDPAKPKLGQIEAPDKDINHANRIILANPIFQAFREKGALPAGQAVSEGVQAPFEAARHRHRRSDGDQAGRRLCAGARSEVAPAAAALVQWNDKRRDRALRKLPEIWATFAAAP